uniref:Phorbol-ester/DAG-type domain-containing protein n=1 Tax=Romanomermis culicivorax TaxID=13658 RepID=A0A915JRP1_ROMCU
MYTMLLKMTAVGNRERSPEAAIAATIIKKTTGAEVVKPSPPSLGEIMRSRSHESNLQSPTAVGSTPNIIVQKGPPIVRKSATFGAETSSLNLLASTNNAPRKSSQPQQSSSPNDFKKLSVGAAYSPASPKPGFYTDSLLPVPPKSPCGPMRLDHNIKHRFVRMWKPSMEHCSYCSKVIGIGGERCQYCRIKAHSGCKDLLGDSCGLSTLQKRQMYEYLLTSLGSNSINKRSPSSDLSVNSAFGSLPYSQSMIGSTGSNGNPWAATFLGHLMVADSMMGMLVFPESGSANFLEPPTAANVATGPTNVATRWLGFFKKHPVVKVASQWGFYMLCFAENMNMVVSTSGPESASSSSCNSSAPSTPAFGPLKSAGPIGASSPGQPGHVASASYAYLQSSRTKFTFPEPGCQPEVPFIHVEAEPSDSSSAFFSTVVNSESSGDASTIYGSWDGGRGTKSVEEKSNLGDTVSSNEGSQDLGHQWQRNKW